MTILEMNNKHLEDKIRKITPEKLSSEIKEIKFIGGGSFGKVFKVVLDDGRTVAVKAFRRQGANEEEALQLKVLSANTSVKMPYVLFTYADESVAYYAALHEASCRLQGGLIMPLWEELCNIRLKKEIKKIKR